MIVELTASISEANCNGLESGYGNVVKTWNNGPIGGRSDGV